MIVPFECPACKATIEAEMKNLRRKVVACTSCNEEVQVPDDLPIGPGCVIGNGYRLEEKIGDTSLGEQYVAIKGDKKFGVEILSGETSRDQEKVTRLMQETDTLASMQHDNIVQAVEAGQDSETYFLVTVYEPGMALDKYLEQNAPLTCETALEICSCISDALGYAWEEKKILHRDIKPQNIFITDDGSARLTGFGIAKSSEGQSLGLTGVGFTIGTPEYMSPEQIQAAEDLDFRSDIYALGIVLYQCVTGELPFQNDAPILLLNMHLEETPEPANQRNPDVTVACSALIDKMLAKERGERQASWSELTAEMKKAMAATEVAAAASAPAAAPAAAATPAAAPAASGGSAEGNKMVPLVIGAVVVIAILIVILIVVILGKG